MVGKDTSLFQATHASKDGNVCIAIVNSWQEIVLLNNFWRCVLEEELHVLWGGHGSVKIIFFNVHCAVFCIGSGQDTVPQQFGRDEAGGSSADFAGVIESVTAYSEAGAVCLHLVWFDVAYKTAVTDLGNGGDIGVGGELDGVGAFDAVTDTLCKSSKFVGGGAKPRGLGVLTGDEFAIVHRGTSERASHVVHEEIQVIGDMT